jgi:hypothetical protein
MEQHYSGKLLASAAIVAVAVSIGAGRCRQNLAKGETVLRAQRWQSWRSSYGRSTTFAPYNEAI